MDVAPSAKMIFLSSILVLAWAGCGDDQESSADAGQNTETSPVGNWTTSGDWLGAGGQFTCFHHSGAMHLGDSMSDLTRPPCCSWSEDGTFELRGKNIYSGTWVLEGGRLILSITNPPANCSPNECGPISYQKDPSVPCDFSIKPDASVPD